MGEGTPRIFISLNTMNNSVSLHFMREIEECHNLQCEIHMNNIQESSLISLYWTCPKETDIKWYQC